MKKIRIETKEFYELMQDYKHAPLTDFDGVNLAYKKVKQYIHKIVKNENTKTYYICDQCGSTAEEVDFEEYKRIKKKFNLMMK